MYQLQLPPEPLTRGLLPPRARSLCPQLNLLNPPQTKFLGMPLVTKVVIRWGFSWPFSGSFNPSGSLDEIICLKGNPCQLPRKTHATVSQMPFKTQHTQDKKTKTKEEIQTVLCGGHTKHSKISSSSSNFT